MYCRHCGKENKDGASFCRHCGGELARKKVDKAAAVMQKKMDNDVAKKRTTMNKKRTLIAVISSILVLCVLATIITVFSGIVKPNIDEKQPVDSIYKLTKEHIAQDEETLVHYTDNIILAFIDSGLNNTEKEAIADTIDGRIVAQLSGSINILQIEVERSSYNKLNELSEKLSLNDNVYSAYPDVLINKNTLDDSSPSISQETYNEQNQWWFSAIEADYVWNNYSEYIQPNTVGVIECKAIDRNHKELEGKVTFTNEKMQKRLNDDTAKNDPEGANHATSIVGIITAGANESGIVGISNQSNISFASINLYDDATTSETWEEDLSNHPWEEHISSLVPVFLMKMQIESDVKLINCSFACHVYDEYFYECAKSTEGFDTYKDYNSRKNKNKYNISEERFYNVKDSWNGLKSYDSYDDYLQTETFCGQYLSRMTAEIMCQLIKNKKDFLIIQGAGNGANNWAEYGIDSTYSSFVAGITYDLCWDICEKYDLTIYDLKERIMIVSGVDNNIENGNYKVYYGLNHGETVDICAPGIDIFSCSASDESGYSTTHGTSLSTPMVTGTAAVLWGIDPTLTAAEVKQYIIQGSKCKAIVETGEDAGREYPMLNVRGAVELLLKHCNISVYDADTGEPIEGVTVSYDDKQAITDNFGDVDIRLLAGEYDVDFLKSGYKKTSETLTIKDDALFSPFPNATHILEVYLEKDSDVPDKNTYSSSKTKLSLTQKTKHKISAGSVHMLGLNSDGTVVAAGFENFNRLDVDNWKGIVAVCAGHSMSVGLKSNGTVLVTDEELQYAVEGWNGIVDIDCAFHIVGLKKDGTVIVANSSGRPDWGQCDTSSWNNIIQVAAGDKFTAGLKNDGSVIFTGELENSDEVESWDDIVSIATGFSSLFGIKEDGTVVVAGLYRTAPEEHIDVSDWNDIVSIDASENDVLGLKSDGSVVYTCGYPYYDANPILKCENWKNVIAISNDGFAVGLTEDGKILVLGDSLSDIDVNFEETLKSWDLID